MPSLPSVPLRRERPESDDGEESETSNPSPPSSNKRRRLETDDAQSDEDGTSASNSHAGDGEGGLSQSQQPSLTNAAPQTSSLNTTQNGLQGSAGSNGFKPGSIVRIKLSDFVTYTSAEFFLGPKLNMVIGPNGTGKSTLVCAICLGLGWGTQPLGRAKDPGEFVKHGCREANIEIELAGPPRFRKNPIICRTIKREGNRSTYSLNGKQVSRSQVAKLVQSFSIQIDNLCQFLPQDKVSEFAALTPIELLHSTQRAAAGPEMIEWHENLKVLRDEQKQLQTDNKGDKDLLANLRNRQEMQRPDVERMRQRAQVKRKIEIMEAFRPITRYKDHHHHFKQVRENKNNLEQELRQLQEELEPALRAVNSKQHYCSQIDEVIRHKKREVSRAESAASQIAGRIEQYENSMKDLNAQIEAERRSGQKHRQEENKIHQSLERLRRQLDNDPGEFDVDFYNERIREKRQEMRDIENQATEIKSKRQPLLAQLNEKKKGITHEERQLSNLDSQRGRQEEKLRGASRDSYRAYMWIQDNQDKFEKEIFGPPIVSCSVKDPKYADAIESLFQKNDFTTFTTQNRNDFRTLQRILLNEMGLFDISIRTCSAPLASFPPPGSDEDLKRLGFDGWAKDYLSAPEPVLAMLCSENRLHRTPVVLRDISDDEFSRMESGSITSWVAGKHTYQVNRRREYGPNATSTRVRQVRPARVWTTQPVNETVKSELERNIRALGDEIKEIQEAMEGDKAEVTRMKEAYEASQHAKVELEKEKGAKQSALVEFRAVPEKIRQQETKQRDIQRFFEEVRDKVIDIRSRQDQISIQKAEKAIEYADSVENLRRLHEELIKIEVRVIEGISDLESLKHRNAEHQNTLEGKRREVEEAMHTLRESSRLAKQLQKEATEAMKVAQRQEDSAETLQVCREYTTEQLDADIDSEKARLELTQGGNNNVIKEYDDRAIQIQQLENKLTEFQDKLSEFDHAINEIRGKWEPKLEELVKRISDAFSDSFARIGCAGQVTLDKAEGEAEPNGESGGTDFGEWSIQIYVKFREHENLSQLDSHRQSGGERAVSTIFYLMALQSLSASPFRVVDEINQGMDPRNERMVHERLVDIACASGGGGGDGDDSVGGSGGSQYFLITPKLLNGLAYKPGMTVHCINSGVLMADYKLVDFSRATQRLRGSIMQSGKGKGRVDAIPNGLLRNGSVHA